MPKVVRTNFLLKYPDFEGRDAFSITVREIFDEGKPNYYLLKNERLNAINKQWQESKKTKTERDRLLFLAKEVRSELNKVQRTREGRERLLKQHDNIQILNDFIDANISDRGIKSERDQKNDFTRAVYLLGNISLKTASIKDIQKQIDKIQKNTIHRRTCSRLNSLLKFHGRGERLRFKKYDVQPFIITEEDFLKLYPNLEVLGEHTEFNRHIQNLAITLFYSGLRMGEAFALQKSKLPNPNFPFQLNFLDNDIVRVNSQMERLFTKEKKINICLPKTGKTRSAILSSKDFVQRIKEWVDLPIEKKHEMRYLNFSAIFKKALKSTFPDNFHGHYSQMKPHDLRHSYAYACLQQGLTITQISKLLGNSVTVCEKYYLRYSMDEDGLNLIRTILTENKRKLSAA